MSNPKLLMVDEGILRACSVIVEEGFGGTEGNQ